MSSALTLSPLRRFLPAWAFTLLAVLGLEVVFALVLRPMQVAFGGPFVFAVTVISLVVWTLRALREDQRVASAVQARCASGSAGSSFVS